MIRVPKKNFNTIIHSNFNLKLKKSFRLKKSFFQKIKYLYK